MRRSLYQSGTSRTVLRDKEGHDETPERFETPGPAVNLCACEVSESSEGEDKMASVRGGPADWIIYVISAFRRGEEGTNGIGSFKTDIYFTLGCVSFAASSIL